MSISDAEYAVWLLADNKRRCVLVEMEIYQDGAVATLYFSNTGYTTSASDTPAHRYYEARVAGIPAWRAGIDVAAGFGALQLTNEDGALDYWIDPALADSVGLDGRPIRIFLGDANWSRADFRPWLTGIIDDVSGADRRTVVLAIRDKSELLNVPVQQNLLPNGDPVPLAFGAVYNATPVLTNGAILSYQIHDGSVYGIVDVRDNGVSVSYTAYPSMGQIQLYAAPVGRVTVDLFGHDVGGGSYARIVPLVSYLVTAHSSLTSADLDAAQLAVFGSLVSSAVGLFIDARENLLAVMLQYVLDSVGAKHYFSRSGLFRLWRLDVPSTPVASFGPSQIYAEGITLKSRSLPVKTTVVKGERNWTQQDPDAMAGSVDASVRDFYSQKHITSSSVSSSIVTVHPGALAPAAKETLLEGAFVSTEAARLAALYEAPRAVFSVPLIAAASPVYPGDTVTITYPRFGFEAGLDVVVVGIADEQPLNNRVVLEVWR